MCLLFAQKEILVQVDAVTARATATAHDGDQYQGCKRDVAVRDRDETETFDFESETRPTEAETFQSFLETEARPRPLI